MDQACPIVPPIMMASMESLAERVSDPFVLKYLNVTEIEFKSLRNVKSEKILLRLNFF